MQPLNNLFLPPSPQKGRQLEPIVSSFDDSSKRRIVSHKANRAPSTSDYKDLHEAVREHAYMRIQTFVVRAQLFESQAVKSDGTVLNVTCEPGHAIQQQGKSGIKAHHAAHASELAGLKENIKEKWLEDIENHKVITPKKVKHFKKRGVSQVAIMQMQHKLQQGMSIRKDLAKVMPGKGFLDHTKADDLINTTDVLPRDVNLIIDKGLEDKIRPFSARLNQAVIKSEKSVKQITQEFIKETRRILNAEKRNLQIERNRLKQLQNPTLLQQRRARKVYQLIRYINDELKGTVMPHTYLLK